ncbi:MAG: hypothetical protein WDZ35_00620 [Crocinitomicaceae bacterium]
MTPISAISFPLPPQAQVKWLDLSIIRRSHPLGVGKRIAGDGFYFPSLSKMDVK